MFEYEIIKKSELPQKTATTQRKSISSGGAITGRASMCGVGETESH